MLHCHLIVPGECQFLDIVAIINYFCVAIIRQRELLYVNELNWIEGFLDNFWIVSDSNQIPIEVLQVWQFFSHSLEACTDTGRWDDWILDSSFKEGHFKFNYLRKQAE